MTDEIAKRYVRKVSGSNPFSVYLITGEATPQIAVTNKIKR